jgi:hypothetical protein
MAAKGNRAAAFLENSIKNQIDRWNDVGILKLAR